MFNDIDDLTKEIELFRKNIKDSGQLCELLAKISEQIKTSSASNNERSITLINKHQALIESQATDLDNKYNGFTTAFLKALEAFDDQAKSSSALNDERSNNLIDKHLNLIENQTTDLDNKYNGFTTAFSNALEAFGDQAKSSSALNDERSNNLIDKHLNLIESQTTDLDNKYNGFTAAFSNAVELSKAQKGAFEKSTTEILKRLNNLEIEALLKEIRKVNTKMFFIFSGIGIAIVLGIIALFI